MDVMIIGILFTAGSIVLLCKEARRYRARQPKTFLELLRADQRQPHERA